jgi:diguanylate cyclase (GGDEF)-like protein
MTMLYVTLLATKKSEPNGQETMKSDDCYQNVRLRDLVGAMDEAPMGVSIINRDLQLVFWNRAFLDILDFPEEIMQPPLMLETLFRFNARRGDYGPGDEEEQVQVRLDLMRTFEPHRFIRTRRDGTIINVIGRVFADAKGEPTGFVTLYQDITREKTYEKELEERNAELTLLQHELVQANADLRANEARILELTRTDPLTGAANRRWLAQRLEEELARSARVGEECSVILVDMDYFKSINDRFGHQVGDEALKGFVTLCKTVIRPYDLVARYGGEEFVLLLPGCGVQEAFDVAERLREELSVSKLNGVPEYITASFGVAAAAPGDDADAVLRYADKALYIAKREGRNRVIASTLATTPAS